MNPTTDRLEASRETAAVTAASSGESWPVVPGYQILAELGRGGMGVVYKALQQNPQRLVALKLIRDSSMAGPEERARFQIEAEAAARVRHPNVVAIYDVGSHQGQPWFAMELIEGGSLAELLVGKPQPVLEAAAMIHCLALAAHDAHIHSIVHRDLKPANILLVESGTGCWTPKIADFGLAKRLDSNSTAWTMDGTLLGTANYMSPEQAAGRVSEIGPGSDIYSLGAILYEMLTGRPPFVAETVVDIVRKVLHEEPVRPTRLRADVPADLETICLKCLEKSSARRYSEAGELAADLDRFLGGKSIAAVAIEGRERLVRLAARDGYEIGDEIGRGPCSVVYQGVHGSLRQTVAIKVFREGLCSEADWKSRLERASHQWAALAHPQILKPQQSGWWDGCGYVIVDHVPQGSPVISAEPSIRQSLAIVENLSQVVSYLHRQGVAHGNLKPTNVLLAADGIPLLCDFSSIGGMFQSPLADDSDVAGLGRLAPELVENRDASPTPSTDVYGLGVILYELLTGRPPFMGSTARDVMEQVRSHEPAPPSTLNANVTSALDTFCLRCLSKNPARRFLRVYNVTARLRDFQNNPDGRAIRRKKSL
jgi:eukaryotic-like serine/threonine-protein kinase